MVELGSGRAVLVTMALGWGLAVVGPVVCLVSVGRVGVGMETAVVDWERVVVKERG